MAKNLKAALRHNRAAAQDLEAALRDCLAAIRARPETVVQGRFRLVDSGRRKRATQPAQM